MTTRTEAWSNLLMPVVFLVAGCVGAVQARGFSPAGQWFPFYTSLAIIVVSLAILARELLVLRATLKDDGQGQAAEIGERDDDGVPPFGLMLLWWLAVVGFAAAVYVVGLLIATPIFVVIALRVGAGVRWRYTALSAALALGALWFLTSSLQLPLPEGLIG